MPNLKIYVDESRWPEARPGLAALLPELRALLCAALAVEPAACQLAVIPVLGLADQPAVNAELHLMPRPERTRAALTDVAERLRDRIGAATGLHAALRIAALDPETYLALK